MQLVICCRSVLWLLSVLIHNITNSLIKCKFSICENILNDFTMWVYSSSNNILIATLRDNSFVHAAPLRQKWVRNVYTVYN